MSFGRDWTILSLDYGGCYTMCTCNKLVQNHTYTPIQIHTYATESMQKLVQSE